MIAAGPDISAPRRVLIVKPSSLGDVVTAMPVLRGLRRTFPEAHISWLVSGSCAPLIKDDGDLDGVIIFDRPRLGLAWRSPSAARELFRLLRRLRAGRFDWAVDLQGLLRSGLLTAATRASLRAGFADAREGAAAFYTHRFSTGASHTADRNIALARQLGIDARPSDMNLQVPPAARQFALRFRLDNDVPAGDYLVCIPPTRGRTKLYPPRHWRRVVAELSHRTHVVLLGAPGDMAMGRAVAEGMGPAVVDLTGKTTVPQMVGIIASSAGVVCSDSAAKFIAPAVGVDVVTLIGPTRVELTGPYLRGKAVVADVPCQGCLKRRCRHVTCMEMIAPADVISAATRMLEGHKA